MIILASQSPRRKELLSWTGLPYTVQPADVDETIHPGESPEPYVLRLGSEKAKAVRLNHTTGVIIAADTAVVDDGEILGKPETQEKAFEYLQQLRGRKHLVISGLIVRTRNDEKILQDICCSEVQMRHYSDEEIREYIQTGDPMDKAGAYAVQHKGFHPVVNFQGCFANVMGLPLCHLVRTWAKYDIQPFVDLPATCQRNLGYDCPVSHRILDGEDIG
jgi:septum formation protein